jgi:mono/diheme cytochrome c family protein
VASGLVMLAGCSGPQRTPPLQVWDDMKVQEKFKPQGETAIFGDDHREARRAPEGAIARGHMTDDSPYNTGMEGAVYTGKNPVPVTMELLKKGQAKFYTYCTPCHDRAGTGQGMVPQRTPSWQPANLTEDRVVQFADGDIFTVITNGRRSMPAYRFQISVEDRWAIIAYVRVLQRASLGNLNDVPAEMRSELK